LRQLIVKEGGLSWQDIDRMDIFQYYIVVDNTYASIEAQVKASKKT
jgi:hypothetical protein